MPLISLWLLMVLTLFYALWAYVAMCYCTAPILQS